MDAKKLLLLTGAGYVAYHFWNQIASALGINVGGPIIIPVNNDPSPSPSVTTTTSNAVVTPTPTAAPQCSDGYSLVNGVCSQNPFVAPAPVSYVAPENTDLYKLLAGYTDLVSFDAWNYRATQVGKTGLPGIEDVFPGMDRATVLSLDQYIIGLKNIGLAGLRGGLGQIFDSSLFLDYYQSNMMPINGKEYC